MATSKISNTIPALGGIKLWIKYIGTGSADEITTSSTKTLLQLGVIHEDIHTYLIIPFFPGIIGNQDTASMYIVRRTPGSSTEYAVTTIHEGENQTMCILIDTAGVAKRKGGTAAASVAFMVADLGQY